MTTWNTIARSKRVEWRRKEAWGPFGPGFGISLELDTSRLDAACRRIPAGAVAGVLGLSYPFRPLLARELAEQEFRLRLADAIHESLVFWGDPEAEAPTGVIHADDPESPITDADVKELRRRFADEIYVLGRNPQSE